MMRLPNFEYHAPQTIDEAVAILAERPQDTMLLAGGTDLLPNMKRRQQMPAVVVSLRRVQGFAEIRNGDGLTIGAGATLSSLVHHAQIRQQYPGVWQAAAQIATPHLRNMGTLGGNLCLDTRCTYYDQNYEWRKAIDFCMKKDGITCWVAPSSSRCLAVSSTDTAPILQALGAAVTLVSARGRRQILVADLFGSDGIFYLTRHPDEILTDVRLPSANGWRSAYWKLRRRGSFDFPVASAAVAARFDRDRLIDIRIVLGAVASRPMSTPKAAALLCDRGLDDDTIAEASLVAAELAKPMDNTDFELVWRKRMVHTLVSGALREIRGDDVSEARQRLARHSLLVVS
jgi:4-hydroxybenzoyl-CoA reductase subunit beta